MYATNPMIWLMTYLASRRSIWIFHDFSHSRFYVFYKSFSNARLSLAVRQTKMDAGRKLKGVHTPTFFSKGLLQTVNVKVL